MKLVIYYFLFINAFTFLMCLIDKEKAKRKRGRIPEKLFFLNSFFGGFLGLILGMKLFHHKTKKKSFKIVVWVSAILWFIVICGYFVLDYLSIMPKKEYKASDFNIEIIQSNHDKNQNGIDDYTDILLGAKKEARRNPKYKSTYYAGGYAPLSEGVCTDVVIRSLLDAGYKLKDMIDEDIKNNIDLYPRVEGNADPNIDFRRVKNLKVFFDRTLEKHTLSLEKIEQWQPGDIVIFGKKYTHIGIISDKRNAKGIPYLIHNAGQPKKEEDVLERWAKGSTITGHYRFSLERIETNETSKEYYGISYFG